MITAWTCTFMAGGVGSTGAAATSYDCVVTASTTPIVGSVSLSSSSSSPLYVQDSGNVVFGLAIIIVFLGCYFMGFLFGFLPKRTHPKFF